MNDETQSLADALNDLAMAYRPMLDQLLVEVAAHWTQARGASDRAVARSELEALTHLAHRIAGSAGSFGYPAVSVAARRLEQGLGRVMDDAATTGWSDILDPLVNGLLSAPAVLERSASAARLERGGDIPAPAGRPLDCPVFVVDPDAGDAERIVGILKPFGYRIRCFGSVEAAMTARAQEAPHAIIIELTLLPDAIARIGNAERLLDGAIPTIIVTGRTDFEARLAAARAGGMAYLVKPLDPVQLISWLDEMTGTSTGSPQRIVVLDDDRALAEYHGAILRAAGMTVEVLDDPVELLGALESFAPDLVLMDMYMPGCTGIELARIVRQHRQYLGMPIVFLSVECDTTRQFAALLPGADDFLTKPIQPDHLVQAIRIRVARARALRSVMETDSLTGLLNHARLKERLRFEQSRVDRQGGMLSFALVDLDHFKRVNDTHGHLAGDRVIKALARLLSSRVRRTDIVGRCGGEEFGIIFPDTGESAAATVLDEIRETFGRIVHQGTDGGFSVTLSSGVAGYRTGEDADALMLNADGALYRAKAEGRDRVKSALDLGRS